VNVDISTHESEGLATKREVHLVRTQCGVNKRESQSKRGKVRWGGSETQASEIKRSTTRRVQGGPVPTQSTTRTVQTRRNRKKTSQRNFTPSLQKLEVLRRTQTAPRISAAPTGASLSSLIKSSARENKQNKKPQSNRPVSLFLWRHCASQVCY